MTDFDALLPAAAAPVTASETSSTPPVIPEAPVPAPQVDEDGAAASADKFGSLVDEVQQDRVTQAQAAAAAMQDTSPDKAAQAISVGKQVGMPPAAVIPSLEQFTAQAELAKNNAILQNNPAVAAWVAGQPDAAKVARDEFDKLDMLSKIAVTLGETTAPAIENELGRQGADLAGENAVGRNNTDTLANVRELQAQAHTYGFYQPTGVYGKVSWGLNQVSGLIDNFVNSKAAVAAGTVAGAGAGALAGGVGALPGAVAGAATGLKFGLAADWGRISAGQTYVALNDMRDANGQPMTETAKQIGAATVGALTFGIGLISGPAQGAVATDALHSLTGDAVKSALMRPTVVTALATITKDVAKGAVQGAATMGAMTLAQQVGQEVSKQISPGDWKTVVNDPQLRAQYIDQLSDAIESGAITFAAMHGVGGALSEYGNYIHSQDAQAQFGQLMDQSSTSKMRGRSPDAFQTFMQSQLQGTNAENVYVPASKIQELYEKNKIAPGPNDGLLGKAVPDILKQLVQAKEINGDVVIPAADYAAHIAGTPLDKAMRNDIRVTQDGMSVNESNEFKAKYQDIISKIGSNIDAQKEEPHNKIYQDMLQKTQDAGFTQAQASQYAAVTAARYAARGARMGQDALDLYHQQGIEVRRGQDGEAPDTAINAFPAKEVPNSLTLDDLEKSSRDQITGENRPVSELLDYLKGDKTLPKDKKPDSLTAFLRKNGGINNDGGEFEAASANKVEKGLVRAKGGMTHDDAALKAWEAGYIGDAGERPDVETFRAAVRQDIAKRDVFSQNDDLLDKGKRAQAAELDQHLHDQGIDIAGKDNSEILKEMQDKGIIAGHPAEEFEQSVFHGSPFHFDKFTLDHIGKGEGAQAYGWGLYFASDKKIAEFYRQALTEPPHLKEWSFGSARLVKGGEYPDYSPRDSTDNATAKASLIEELLVEERNIVQSYVDGKDAGGSHEAGVASAKKDMLRLIDDKIRNAKQDWPASIPILKVLRDRIENDLKFEVEIPKGQLYEADIPDSHEMLDWDKTVEQQPELVKAAIHKAFEDLPDYEREQYLEKKNADIDELKGREVYEILMRAHMDDAIPSRTEESDRSLSNDEAASKYLNDLGVKGIQYLDSNSRAGVEESHNFVVFDDNAIKTLKTYYQDARAKVTMAEGQHIISLFSGADKSTILHEFGHVWLGEMQADAARADAPAGLKTDWETIKKYIGHEDGAIGTEAHETFARSFEAYLMEGKAPSQGLRGAFRRFKQWLTAIYRTVKNLHVPINNDIRQVFDRMLATDDEIRQMEQRQNVNRLFTTKEQAGMTDAEFADYNQKALNAQASAREQLLAEALEEVKKKNGAEWNKAAADIKPGIAEAVRARQDIRALDWFKSGKLRDAEGKEADLPVMPIDKAALEALSPGAEKQLPRGMPVTEEGGAHPDDIAPILGYASGKDMIDDLTNLAKTEKEGGRRKVENFITDQEVNSRLQDKFGVSDAELQQRAEELMGNPDRLDLKLAELRALSRKAGQPVIFTKENIGQWADDHIGAMKATDAANSYQFVRAAAKAGREATRAVLAGKDDEAIQALQHQALNMALADRAHAFEKQYGQAQKLFKYASSRATIKSTAQDYLNQVHALLKQFDFKVNRDPRELENSLKGTNLQDFAVDKLGIGRDVYVADYLLEKTLPNIKELTTEQFSDLHDTVQSLMHNGREEQTITVDGKKVEKDRIITEILDNIKTFKEREKSEFLNPADAGFLRRNLDRFTSLLRGADAELLKPERLMDWLDKRNVMGPLNKYVFKPLKDAQNMANDLLVEQSKSFRALELEENWSKTLKDSVRNDTLIDPDTGKPARMSRKTMLSIALNTGNASNLKKISEGYGWDAANVQNFLQKNMTKSDWDFVQHTWDSFEKLWPRIEALQRRTTGIAPPKIDATPIKTPHGDYRGGYYPVVYDPEKTQVGGRVQALDAIFDNDYFRATTAKGHTIARLQNFTDKIQLSLDVLPAKLKQAVHDLAFREAIVNADKILSDKRFMGALKDTWGPEYGKEFRPWLKDIANGPNSDNRPASFIDKALRYSRMTMVEVGIGFRLTTMAKHGLTALSNSVGEIGPKAMQQGVGEYYSDRSAKQQFVMERSGEMRHRMAQYDRDIRENLQSVLGKSSIIQTMRHFGHYGVAFLDMESAMPTWLGSYRKAMADGMSDTDAAYAADKTVRNAHGAQGQVDMAAIQRGPEYKKMFTMFYGFFNHMYNQERDIVHRAMNDGEYGQVLARTLAYIAVPALVEQAISGHSQQDEGWGKWAAKAVVNQMAATLPLVRDIAAYLEYGHGSETPMSRSIRSIADASKDAGNAVTGNPVSSKWVRHAIEAPGYVAGLPTGQAATAAQFLWDVSDGKENPQDVTEWLHGMMYGSAKKK